MSSHRPRLVLGLVIAGVILTQALPAAAEGAFSSSFSGWLPGVSSRTWNDDNDDAQATTITLAGCRARASASRRVVLNVQLTQQTPWYSPDINRGRKDFDCWSRPSVTQSWGRQGDASYHFTLHAVNGTDSFDDKVSASLAPRTDGAGARAAKR
ncbi:MAG: hypothetical protein U0P45_09925 [Acidimicrobiales bacterium]